MDSDHLLSPKYPLDLSKKPLIGMVHLPPLLKHNETPFSIDETSEICFQDAITLEKAGFDAILIENYHDTPYSKYRLDDARFLIMNSIVGRIKSKISIPFGINILRNACVQALVMAMVNQASFIRCNIYEGVYVTDQGIIEGVAAEVRKKYQELRLRVKILADIQVKHATPLGDFSMTEAATNAIHRGKADAVIVSGRETGKIIDNAKLETFVNQSKIQPILGSGLSMENLSIVFPFISGAIVGTSIKISDLKSPIDYDKASQLSNLWNSKREKEFKDR
ncbi:MAG: BtpA/SgcQ family protein [Candidatus Hodarchaeota archaeon]